ncbi:divalent-cation tolerance protein CutA [Streptomyces sp. NPDC046716]|uniref:divalent-cation tolerance protein CutA n=1 Tax=Streptomyces sp. NPDC046716 TaxID=3157093 RepID=UPI00340C69CB
MPNPESPASVLTVLTTIDDPARAEALARGAVESRLAACAQVSAPVTSVYRWEGAVETAREWQVLLKTTVARYADLESWLKRHHGYAVPEIVALPVVRGSAEYLGWVADEVE